MTTVRSASVPHYEDVALRELVKNGGSVRHLSLMGNPCLGETLEPALGGMEGADRNDRRHGARRGVSRAACEKVGGGAPGSRCGT